MMTKRFRAVLSVLGTAVLAVVVAGCVSQSSSSSSSSGGMPGSFPSSSSSTGSSSSGSSSSAGSSSQTAGSGDSGASGSARAGSGSKKGDASGGGGTATAGAGQGGKRQDGPGGEGDMETATRVFKEAKEQRSGETSDPWAEGENSDGESDWILAGGGSQAGDAESEPGGGQPSESEGEPAGDGQVGDAEGGQPRDLEGEFEKSLEEYDGKIMDERAIIIATANRRAGDRELPPPPGPAGSGAAGPEGAPGGGQGSSRAPTASGTSDIPTTLPPRNTAPGDYDPVQVASVPTDIPPGDDDDVVARQLREAAMSEKDPELRDKLWDEYRRYKNSTQ